MLDFDIEALLRQKLTADRRPPDGLLHCSGDIVGSLRHSQLRAAGAPTVEGDIVAAQRTRTGTMVHHDFERIFRGRFVALEVKLDRWLPTGWSGTADWIHWNPDARAFVLGDLKTAKAEAMPWVLKEGVKESHQHQLSAYWYALRNMGIPLVEGYGVFYLPITQNERENVQPSWQVATPLDEAYLHGLMSDRWGATSAYLLSIEEDKRRNPGPLGKFITDALAPVQERELRTYWNKAASKAKGKETPGVEVKLVPNWSTNYCDYPNELCDCRLQKPEKLGTWMAQADGVRFIPSRGKEGQVDETDVRVHPSAKQIKELKEAYSASQS